MGTYIIEAGGATPKQIDAILDELLALPESKNRVSALSFRSGNNTTVIRRNASTGRLCNAVRVDNGPVLREAVSHLLTGPGTVTVGRLPRK